MIAGLVGLVSACNGKEVSGKKSNTRIMNMVMILTTTVIRKDNMYTEDLVSFENDVMALAKIIVTNTLSSFSEIITNNI